MGFDKEVAQHWRANRKEAEEKAREFTKEYAM
jgi:ubiquitin-protein ligase